MDRQQYGCGVVAFALVLGGTIATGLLPATALHQTVAGGIIVAGFVVLLYCFSDWG